ncbi:UDP-3-O-[3-hydroxymyristoyl] glucosamine N-acyltransferase [Pseudarcicella hirudinis]|uniref:UDP-3-O-acylglucosamine N-acyltransferase n=1 Tax=Pseudarcicella hirudinis TaxID=1079859 RepID=A0A1I5SGC8_9BACT|nr:UDP-3-O-(3-hydroxymyristoyl)glucosamine N-acyltransferase [Pseudarcicella hirudinis]SFP69771.1 UDP-3-O-[3-hydroxymyristoyl] glucosamine N-acyltransferase [Pseudarcicella hirudinis]
MEFTVEQIAQMLNGEIKGDKSLKVTQLSKIEEGKEGSVSFLANLKYEQFLYTTNSTAVIVDKTFEPKKDYSSTLILVENAYSAFTILLQEYQKIVADHKKGIEQPSFIAETSDIGEGIYLGAFSYIGEGCSIGKNVKIHQNVTISDHVSIGDCSVIYPGVKIYKNTFIGENCVIHANAVIGSDGFGFAPQADGSYKTIPQLGNVVIEDNVSIGANTTIDCATMGSTTIRKGVKIDNLVQIAHNVEIGQNTVIAAQSGISGSTKIGENCMIAGQVGIVGHITVPNKTIITAQSGVSKSFKKEGMILGGSPASENKEYLRSQVYIKQLNKLDERLSTLENKFQE